MVQQSKNVWSFLAMLSIDLKEFFVCALSACASYETHANFYSASFIFKGDNNALVIFLNHIAMLRL